MLEIHFWPHLIFAHCPMSHEVSKFLNCIIVAVPMVRTLDSPLSFACGTAPE